MTDRSKSTGKKIRQIPSPPPFHQRFNVQVDIQDAKKRFLNRVENFIVLNFLEVETKVDNADYKNRILWQVSNELGKKYNRIFDFDDYVRGDFHSCLKALEIVYHALPKKSQKEELQTLIQIVISKSEVDLGISWQNGIFSMKGAKLLDEALVNESLQWLSDPKYHNVLAPFQKGLSHFLEATKHPERLPDTITDIYEALEAMAKVVTSRPKRDLSANRELFVKQLGLSDYYNKMLQDYISYANDFRHALEEGKQRTPPLPQEVEAFIYTTGLFIRLAIERINTQKPTIP